MIILIGISLIISYVKHPFMYLLTICMFSLGGKMCNQIFYPFLI